ncbi:MAG: thiol reductant ABC exporter subunit CydC [Alicyclobacillus sp.]|nr:thiol reductant ABC exporter subunit CydC [Alicyclobacillus sp.]
MAAWAAGVALLATAGWLIAAAAFQPPTVLLLWVPMVLVRAYSLARAGLRYLERLAVHAAALRAQAAARVQLFAVWVHQAPRLLQTRSSGELLAAAAADAEELPDLYHSAAALAVAAASTLLLSLALAIVDGRLALWVGGCACLLGATGTWAAVVHGRRLGLAVSPRRSRLYKRAAQTAAALAELWALGRLSAWQKRWQADSQRLQRLQQRLYQHRACWLAVTGVLPALTLTGVLWRLAELRSCGQVSGPLAVGLSLAVWVGVETVASVPQAAVVWGRVQTARRRLQRVAALPVPGGAPVYAPQGLQSPGSAVVVMRGLRCRYGPEAAEVLRGLDAVVPAGQHVAVVGASGAGKSTLAAVLGGICPYTGELTIGGVPVRELAGRGLHAWVAVCEQDPYVFDASLAANVRLGRADASDEDVRAALSAVGLLAWAEALPDGLATRAGEAGAALSGGQRQRLALARLLVSAAPVWVADEPAAALDPLSERQLLQTLRLHGRGRTLFWMTHRLAGLAAFDEIWVLAEGRLAERGTHAQLLAQGGIYAQMWQVERDRWPVAWLTPPQR